jgi:hypothetical protein
LEGVNVFQRRGFGDQGAERPRELILREVRAAWVNSTPRRKTARSGARLL